MKTNPWQGPARSVQQPFSAQELSIADMLTLKVADQAPSKVSFVAGVYTAILCFRRGIPVELWSDRCPTPLIRYQNPALTVHEALAPFIADIDAVCSSEQEAALGAPKPAAEPAVATPSTDRPRSSPGTGHRVPPAPDEARRRR